MNQRTGALEATVLRVVGRQAEVCDVETVGEQFRLVTICGEQLVNRAWTAGDMIQVSFGGWQSRSYTPLAYHRARGSMQFLGYVHGNGIGSNWLASLNTRDECVFVGPRAAVDLGTVIRPTVFFGDETSFSTAAAMCATQPSKSGASFVFEVTSLESCAPIIHRLGLGDAKVIQRQPNDSHLDAVEAHVFTALDASTRYVFTGRAASIARLYKAARRVGVSRRQITNVAYWAPGRKGFSGVQR